jgi:hypothetical protein
LLVLWVSWLKETGYMIGYKGEWRKNCQCDL